MANIIDIPGNKFAASKTSQFISYVSGREVMVGFPYEPMYTGFNGTPIPKIKPIKGFRRLKGVGDEIDKKEQKAIWQAERRNSCYGKM